MLAIYVIAMLAYILQLTVIGNIYIYPLVIYRFAMEAMAH